MNGVYKKYGNYDRFPKTVIKGYDHMAFDGCDAVIGELKSRCKGKTVIVLDCYPGVDIKYLIEMFSKLEPAAVFDALDCAVSKEKYQGMIAEFLTDDRVFGMMCNRRIDAYFDKGKLTHMREQIERIQDGIVLLCGVGAALVTRGDILVYCDMARWEIQTRYKQGMPNWNTDNVDAPFLSKYKQGFFVEWRFADRHKTDIVWGSMDYLLDTNQTGGCRMVCADAFFAGLEQISAQPFRLVPYFDPGVWGGQWMMNVCGLPEAENYAWSFDGVPEENSLYLQYGDTVIEMPAMDLVLYRPGKLLGERVHARFGAEFPIRFDFLDTIDGQNLSLQVHPLTEYIQKTFGMHYTQDESYYILDCKEGADTNVYLGVKTGVDREAMMADLRRAQAGEISFPDEKYINKIPVKKHDHILIPAGTIHCSGADTMVLEISATPYIFTFKLWDWDRLGLDGLPRPIHIEHGEKVIQWDRDTEWVMENLVNRFETLEQGDGYSVVKTGLHEREFIETVRHQSDITMLHNTNGSVNVLNLVEGAEAVVASPINAFAPFVVHYAETFIIPACVGEYTITPHGGWAGREIMTIKASVK